MVIGRRLRPTPTVRCGGLSIWLCALVMPGPAPPQVAMSLLLCAYAVSGFTLAPSAVPTRSLQRASAPAMALSVDMKGKVAFVAGVADSTGYGWAICKVRWAGLPLPRRRAHGALSPPVLCLSAHSAAGGGVVRHGPSAERGWRSWPIRCRTAAPQRRPPANLLTLLCALLSSGAGQRGRDGHRRHLAAGARHLPEVAPAGQVRRGHGSGRRLQDGDRQDLPSRRCLRHPRGCPGGDAHEQAVRFRHCGQRERVQMRACSAADGGRRRAHASLGRLER